MKLNIGVIKGDGIGPEIVTEAMKVLDRIAEVYGHECVYTQLLMGGASIDVHGVPLTDETISKAKLCDAVFDGLDRRRYEDFSMVSTGAFKTSRSRTVKN